MSNRHNESGPQVTHTSSIEQNVFDSIQRNPSISVRAVAVAVKGSGNGAQGVLKREGLHPYHIQRVPQHIQYL
ncbi:hypothetical protein TNCV_3198591 [Trichonephila clavipes]|nr:hypothetical protein TNCV_3198591 [Trichonephila clavipes]